MYRAGTHKTFLRTHISFKKPESLPGWDQMRPKFVAEPRIVVKLRRSAILNAYSTSYSQRSRVGSGMMRVGSKLQG